MRQVVRKNQANESDYVLTKDLTELLKTEEQSQIQLRAY